MLWLAAAREGLDDDHAATAAGTWTRHHARLIRRGGRRRFGLFRGGWNCKQLARERRVGGTVELRIEHVASGWPSIAMVFWVTVARSPMSERKLWTGNPSSVR